MHDLRIIVGFLVKLAMKFPMAYSKPILLLDGEPAVIHSLSWRDRGEKDLFPLTIV